MLPTQPNLKQLFQRIAQGDAASFESVYNHFYPRLFAVTHSYCRNRELAEDTVHQILLRVWEKKEELSTIEHPLTWLHTAAKYEIWQALRKVANARDRNKQYADAETGEPQSPEEQLIAAQQENLIREAIQSLTPRQLEVYRMGREQGMTYAEIAARLGISHETVKDLMARALRHIREALHPHRDEFLIFLFIQFFL